jgi:hypothetical protein
VQQFIRRGGERECDHAAVDERNIVEQRGLRLPRRGPQLRLLRHLVLEALPLAHLGLFG